MIKRQIEMAVLVLREIPTIPETRSLVEVAEAIGCSISYVEKITRPLVNAGLVFGRKRVGSSRSKDFKEFNLREVCEAMAMDTNNVGNFDDSLLPYFEKIKLSAITE